jgi:hypothetical protein
LDSKIMWLGRCKLVSRASLDLVKLSVDTLGVG